MAGEQKPLVFNGSTGGFDEVTPKTVSAGASDAGKLFVPGSDGKWDAGGGRKSRHPGVGFDRSCGRFVCD